ncbi:MAG: DUF2971 domain-containing protein [Gammaproteobacteria bacterium]|nr:DUF2971 domain-containing protein [Gammaproteobacteria bacterium]
MRDSLEMHWGYHQWEWAAGQLLDSLGRGFIDRVDEILSQSSLHILPLISCFSTASDVLSQWRAYAKDGEGFCIGFAQSTLCRMGVRPVQVLYDESQQRAEILQAVKALHAVDEAERNEKEFFSFCVMLAADLAAMKNPAFSEEKEVRLIHLVNFEPSGDFLKLQSTGGTAFEKPLDPPRIQYEMRGSVPNPFVDLTFQESGVNTGLREVVIGPCNEARTTAIKIYLETLGLGGVNVTKSAASYRAVR